jgi:hypothetical protein
MTWAFLATLVVVLFFTAQHGPPVAIFSILVTAALGLPLLGGAWRGFELRPAGGQFSPIYAVYPLGFGEIARMILKANLARLATGLPFVFALAAAGSWRLTGEVVPGLILTAKGLGFYLASLPVIMVLRFSAATNDTKLNPGLIVAVPLLAFLWLATSIPFLTAETLGMAVLGLTLVVLMNTALLAVYARAWSRGRFDLLTDRSRDDLNSP